MKKLSLFCLIAMFAVTITAIGCDNRSQLEKDVDKAADKVKGSVK